MYKLIRGFVAKLQQNFYMVRTLTDKNPIHILSPPGQTRPESSTKHYSDKLTPFLSLCRQAKRPPAAAAVREPGLRAVSALRAPLQPASRRATHPQVRGLSVQQAQARCQAPVTAAGSGPE